MHFTHPDGDSGAVIEKNTVTANSTICGTRSLRVKISGPAGKRYHLEVQGP